MIYWMQISAGRGPEECRWVVSQLVRHIITEGEKRQLEIGLIDVVPGNFKATLRSALLSIRGDEAVADYANSWQGTVQWIGTSMFRRKHKRKNWFVDISVLEPVPQSQWREQDIRIETMRASGPGGQHVNKNETAVRVSHLPSGISVVSQEERSQHLNRELALARLRDRLHQQEEEKKMQHQQQRWRRHDLVERGNAIKIFTGINFKLKSNADS